MVSCCWNANPAYLQRPSRAGLHESEDVMNRCKGHRVVSAKFGEGIAAMQISGAVERAENEGWPIPPSAVESRPSIAKASAVRHVAKHIACHFRSEFRFWTGFPERRQKACL